MQRVRFKRKRNVERRGKGRGRERRKGNRKWSFGRNGKTLWWDGFGWDIATGVLFWLGTTAVIFLTFFFLTLRINPLSTGKSKIGRRRPISLDYHCVNISQQIFINKISLERSFHYLNADTLFLKIGQEMTPLQPFEVTQLIDFALDRSTNVTCGRDFAHSITMVTWNV